MMIHFLYIYDKPMFGVELYLSYLVIKIRQFQILMLQLLHVLKKKLDLKSGSMFGKLPRSLYSQKTHMSYIITDWQKLGQTIIVSSQGKINNSL